MHRASGRWSLLVLVLSCLLMEGPSAQRRTIDDFFTTLSDDWVRLDPNLAVRSRYFSGDEQSRLERQLRPLTEEHARRQRELARRGLADLRRFDLETLNVQQRVSAQVLDWQLQTLIEEEKYQPFRYPLEQMNGANVILVNAFAVAQPVQNARDAGNYVVRLEQVGARMREATAVARNQARAGVVPPRFIVEALIKQMQAFVGSLPVENTFVTTLSEKMVAAGVSRGEQEQLQVRAVKIVESDVYPAWREAIAFLQQVIGRTTDSPGLSRFKGGREVYETRLRRYTTTNLTADEIHSIGLREVSRIESELNALLRRIGRSQGSLVERLAQIADELRYPDTDEGRKQVLADANAILKDAEQRASLQFDKRPRTAVVIEPYPRFQEANAAASYAAPPADGSRPGLFRIPLRAGRYMSRFGMRSVVYHEAIPGHHFQTALQVENNLLPRFRRLQLFGLMNAFSEGWGLYAERLAAESGWYEGDDLGLVGYLERQLFRAKRLVVDTGLHAKGWTRQQAIDYGIEPSEVDRYVVDPGQACAYMIGQMEILRVRDMAKQALQDKFSEKAFHNAMLSVGSLPLAVLEKETRRFIQEQR
jgi:uncharacterized protein (DUF885 family)